MYPARLVDFLTHLRERVADPAGQAALDPRTPARQLLVSSHLPAVPQALGPVRRRAKVRDDVVFVDTVTRVDPAAPRSRTSRVRWLRPESVPGADPPGVDEADADVEVPAHQIVSESEVAEFEVRSRLEV